MLPRRTISSYHTITTQTTTIPSWHDLVILDRAALDDDALMDVPPVELLFARASGRHLKETLVAGRSVVKDGAVTGVDLAAVHRELRAAMRGQVEARSAFRAALPELEAVICRHFSDRLGCC